MNKQADGYQIQYSIKKKMKSAKTIIINSYKTTSKIITKLPSKETYHVRVRAFKESKSKFFYSGWSDIATVVTK